MKLSAPHAGEPEGDAQSEVQRVLMNSKIIGESTTDLIIKFVAVTWSARRLVDNRMEDLPLARQRCQINRKLRRQKNSPHPPDHPTKLAGRVFFPALDYLP